MRQSFFAFLLLASLPVASASSDETANAASSRGAVAYDSVSGSLASGGHGFLNHVEIGQAITLEGGARQVTQIDLRIGVSFDHVFRTRFYKLDGTGGSPGTMIWESPIQDYPYTPGLYNQKTVTVEVPNIVVPTSFAWIVALAEPSGYISLLSSDAPSVGGNLNLWRRGVSQPNWRTFNLNTNVLGARVFAVPEPSAFAIAATSLFALSAIRRRASIAR